MKRIGYNNTSEIKSHPWFANVDWDQVDALTLSAPIKPELRDKFDTEHFNKELLKERFLISFKFGRVQRNRSGNHQKSRGQI